MVPVHQEGRRRERLLVVGGGMASLKLVEELVEQCPDRYEIVVAAKEKHPPYNRVLLSSLLAGEAQEADIELQPASWYGEKGVALLGGVEASGLRPARQQVVLSNGARLGYDRLVLATGSKAIRLPVPGHALPGVLTFRDLDDVGVLQLARPGSRAVVIGGGLLGIEAACGLAKRGLAVTLIHIMPRLMERQLDPRAAVLLKAAIEGKGIEVVLEAQTAAIEGDGKAERVILKDGRAFPADLVVMAAGIRPETTLAESGGVEIGRGIKVDDKLETNWPGIYAIGECAEHRGACCGVVEPVYEQAKVLARYLSGRPARYEGSADSRQPQGVWRARLFDGRLRGRGCRCHRPGRRRHRQLPQAGGPRQPSRRCRAVRRYRRRVLVSRSHPSGSGAGADPRVDRLRQSACRGGLRMSAQDFTEDQRRYLEGFVSGVQARRAAQGLRPLGAEGGSTQPAGPDKEHLAAMARFEAAGKKLSPEEKAKREEHPFDAYARFKSESAKGQFPKGIDNFRWRFHGLFYVAPTQNSYMCRLRIPNGILSHWQLAGVADLAERHGGGYAHVTTRANLQIRDVMPDGAVAL